MSERSKACFAAVRLSVAEEPTTSKGVTPLLQ
jgi:hypothetical protein